ncbi:MAG TPA: hypothetical protein VLH10_07415 [Yinghuangia sp.]|nr:hypothetical protein [Yinghuangia sp.]
MRGSEVAAWSPTDSLAVRPPDGYEPVRVLGTGVYGMTLLCREPAAGDRETVLVVLRPRPAAPAERARFHTELLAAAAAARHPCTALVRDVVGTGDGDCCLVMDWYPGGAFPADEPVPVDEVVLAGIRAALSLRAAHRRGVLHLDVRPGALLRGTDGEVYLSGHGVARAVERAAPDIRRSYDPAYAPRELTGWEPPGPACDVAMLGATMYALLDGSGDQRPGRPVAGASLTLPPEPIGAAPTPAPLVAPPDEVEAAYRALAQGRVATPRGGPLPPQLAALLRRMLAPNPADRPSVAEVHGALCALAPATVADRVPRLDPEPDEPDPLLQPDPPEEPYEDEEDDPEHEARQRRRRRWLIAMAVAGALLFAGGAWAIVRMDDGGGKKAPAAGSSPSAPPGASGPGGPARLLTPSEGSQYAPRDVTTVAFGDSVQVAWQPPADAAAQAQVAGYLVLAQDAQGSAVDRRNTPSTTTNAVFTLPRAGLTPTGPVCYTVTTLVRLPDNTLGLAPAAQVCPARPNGTPSTGPGSSGPTPTTGLPSAAGTLPAAPGPSGTTTAAPATWAVPGSIAAGAEDAGRTPRRFISHAPTHVAREAGGAEQPA